MLKRLLKSVSLIAATMLFVFLVASTAEAAFTDTWWEKPYGTTYITPSDSLDVQIGNLTVTGVFTFSGTMGSDLDMAGYDLLRVDHIFGDTNLPVNIGDAGSTSHTLTADDDLFVSGKIEVDGAAYFDGNYFLNGAAGGRARLLLTHADAAGLAIYSDSASDQGFIGLSELHAGRQLIISDYSWRERNFDHATQTNPTLYVHSATDPDSDNTEWLSLAFDPTLPGAVVATGKGTVRIDSTLSYAPSADTAQANDSAVSCANGIMRIVGDGGATLLDTDPAISDGLTDGQTCIIEGTSDTNTVTIADGNNIEFDGGVNFIMGIGDTLWIHWDSGDSTWYEISRSDN